MFNFPDDYRSAAVCVICEAELAKVPLRNGEQDYFAASCKNCGTYKISGTAYSMLAGTWRDNPKRREYLPLLSHQLRLRQRPTSPPFVLSSWLESLLSDAPQYPDAIEQIENLVIHLAETLRPGEATTVQATNCQAVAGSSSRAAFAWVVESALERGLIQGKSNERLDDSFQLLRCSLTWAGWEWYREIGRHKRSRVAFMAMPYGQPELDAVVTDYFKPAVAEAGFKLFRLDEEPQAGVIDNRLRVEIRRSRLLIADITHNNHGAIWEAGFAEGLGLPVIYTCESSKIEGKHFDIRNCQMVPWRREDPAEAAKSLKATIRNTLPDETVLEDAEVAASPNGA